MTKTICSRAFALARSRISLAALLTSLAAASCVPAPRPVGTAEPPLPPGRPSEPVEQAPTPAPAPAPAPVPTGAPTRFDLHEEPTIDVGMAWDLDSLVVEPVETGGSSFQHAGKAPDGLSTGYVGALVISRGPDGYLFEFRQRRGQTPLASGDTLWTTRTPDKARPADRIRWNSRTWRGAFKIFVNPRGKLTIAARLPLETYLNGVVPGEIGALDEHLIEAGRAQAVAARSYTLFYRGRRAAEGFDLYGSVEDQVFGPIESERAVATRCVETTRGTLALAGGFPIRANYYSTCGGITADVWEAWPAPPLSYLVSHTDAGDSLDWCANSPQYRWRERWSVTEFMSNLTRFAPQQNIALPAGGVGELVDVVAEARSRSGRVWRLRVLTTTGDIVIPAYSIRQVLRRGGNPTAILRSNLFKIDVRRDPGSRRALEVVASGAGSGHGVGLCQTGALSMANSGRSAADILEQYYRGAVVKKLY
jgi:stage II sporulation protein D